MISCNGELFAQISRILLHLRFGFLNAKSSLAPGTTMPVSEVFRMPNSVLLCLFRLCLLSLTIGYKSDVFCRFGFLVLLVQWWLIGVEVYVLKRNIKAEY